MKSNEQHIRVIYNASPPEGDDAPYTVVVAEDNETGGFEIVYKVYGYYHASNALLGALRAAKDTRLRLEPWLEQADEDGEFHEERREPLTIVMWQALDGK